MKKSIIFMFNGQGTQYYHMAEELYNSQKKFKKTMDYLDKIINEKLGYSVIKKMYNKTKTIEEVFDNLLISNLSIFIVQYSLSKFLIENGIVPNYVLGASLGECTAVAVSEMISCEEAIDFLINQSKLIEKKVEAGGMVLIMGKVNAEKYVELINLGFEIAGINHKSSFLVSYKSFHFDKLVEFLNTNKIKFIRLAVKFPFHSTYIDVIKEEFFNNIKYRLKKGKISCISCCSNKKINENIDYNFFWNMIRMKIDLYGTIRLAESINNHIYIDIGPGKGFINVLKQSIEENSSSKWYDILNPKKEDIKNIENIIGSFKIHIQK